MFVNKITCFATIVSANYLAYVKVLAASIFKFHPGIQLKVLIVDRPTQQVKGAVKSTKLDITYAQDLEIPDFEFLAFKYNLVELNTALKPTFLKMLFNNGYENVVYLDPDIKIFGELTAVFLMLQTHEIVLTPHSLAPIMDGFRPSDIDFLRTGVFNLGFIALKQSRQSIKMLDWWENRCLNYGFNDTNFGTFVDQKWIDLVPAYFDGVGIIKNAGLNVAYWNLHERVLEKKDDIYFVNGERLIFFHFSGVRADKPKELSHHQNRHLPGEGSCLMELVNDYCAQLKENLHSQYSVIKYTYGSTNNGEKICGNLRRGALCFVDDLEQLDGVWKKQLFKLGNRGLIISRNRENKPFNTSTFDQKAFEVLVLNKLIIGLSHLIGLNHLMRLCRYGSLLCREDYLIRVLLKKELNFKHLAERRRRIAPKELKHISETGINTLCDSD